MQTRYFAQYNDGWGNTYQDLGTRRRAARRLFSRLPVMPGQRGYLIEDGPNGAEVIAEARYVWILARELDQQERGDI